MIVSGVLLSYTLSFHRHSPPHVADARTPLRKPARPTRPHACGIAPQAPAPCKPTRVLVRRCMCCLGFVQGCVDTSPSVAFELLSAYAAARASDGPLASALQAAGGASLAASIAEFHDFLKANLPLLARSPSLLLQQARNAPEDATSLRADAANSAFGISTVCSGLG